MNKKADKALNSAEIVQDLHDENGNFKPGHPKVGGKKKGTKHFTTLIAEMLKEKIQIKKDGQIIEMTVDKAMVEAMIRQVIKGDVKAFQALTDRHDGKPHQSIDMEVSEPPVPIMPLTTKQKKKNVQSDDSDE